MNEKVEGSTLTATSGYILHRRRYEPQERNHRVHLLYGTDAVAPRVNSARGGACLSEINRFSETLTFRASLVSNFERAF